LPNPIWSGAVSFGMVSIPVRLYPATESKDVKFHLLHKHDGSRITQRYYCPEDGEVVEWDELVRGYEVAPGRYVVMTDEDFASIPINSVKAIEISHFVNLCEVDPILFQGTYYLQPEQLGEKPYALLKQVMQESARVAIARFTLRTKEHACVLRVYNDVLALSPLFYKDEVRTTEPLKAPDTQTLPDDALTCAVQLIEAMSDTFDHAKYSDRYRHGLLQVINEKAAELPADDDVLPPAPSFPDLMEALRKTVEEVQKKSNRKMQAAPA
jgi:DNA end-binding protein Ku